MTSYWLETAALSPIGRIKRALGDLHLQLRRVDAMQGAADRRMLDLRDRYRLGQGFRQRPHDRLHRRKAGRLIADELTVARDRGLQRRLRAERGRLGACKARLRLRDVGARHFADSEAVPRLAQLFLQDVDVVAVEVENGRILQHVHIGGEARKKGVLLGVAQLLPRAEDLRLGLTDGIERPVAVEDGLVGAERRSPAAWQ